MSARPLVLKFGGELLEDPAHLATVVSVVKAVATGPTVIVHGGGKEIDAALKVAGLEKRQVDGLRVTDQPTLDVVVSVLAGTTPGVLDERGVTLPVLETAAVARLVNGGTATAGMIAKLRACEHALAGGVDDVVIVDGRDRAALDAAVSMSPLSATRIIAGLKPCATTEDAGETT